MQLCSIASFPGLQTRLAMQPWFAFMYSFIPATNSRAVIVVASAWEKRKWPGNEAVLSILPAA